MTHQQHWELAHDTGIVERNGLTYLAALPDGPIVVLDAVARGVSQVPLDRTAEAVTLGGAGGTWTGAGGGRCGGVDEPPPTGGRG